jgi:hypothetical protein
VVVSGRLFSEPAAHATERVPVASVTIVVYDLGPEPAWHQDRSLYGPWLRYAAEPADYPAVSELGGSPWETPCTGWCRTIADCWSGGGRRGRE